MAWKIFGGDIANILEISLKPRCHNDGLNTDKETLVTCRTDSTGKSNRATARNSYHRHTQRMVATLTRFQPHH